MLLFCLERWQSTLFLFSFLFFLQPTTASFCSSHFTCSMASSSICQPIPYKLSLLCYKSFSSLLPSYLSDLLSPYSVSRTLCSTSNITRLSVPRYRLQHYGKRAFSRSALSVWNSLPTDLCEINTTNSFKTHLKTHLFHTFYTLCPA